MTSPPRPRPRVNAIDITRGSLMTLIIVSHAAASIAPGVLNSKLQLLLNYFYELGTPGFTLVSGLLLGYFGVVRRDMAPILAKYKARGVTLLWQTHALIALAIYLPLREAGQSFPSFFVDRWYITDTLAVIFIFFAPWSARQTPRVKLFVGIACLTSAQLVASLWLPPYDALIVLKQLFVGPGYGPLVIRDTYPIVQLTGMFLIGSAIGTRYGEAVLGDQVKAFLWRLVKVLPILIVLTGIMGGSWAVAKMTGYTTIKGIFYPIRTFSLFPAYLAAFLSIFVFVSYRTQLKERSGPIDEAFRVFGRTSLFTYVTQYYAVQTIPFLLGWFGSSSLVQFAVILAIGLPLLYVIAKWWDEKVKSKPRGTPKTTPTDEGSPSAGE